jgi:N-acetylglucosaminyldiphosphoundecaprenol N-acetyl-beta-D-mannosaminyltransferase
MKKTPGPDVFESFLLSKKNEIRQYFIGSDAITLQGIAQRLEISYDSDFFFSPTYTSDINELQNQISFFLSNKPYGLVWLGLGGTKQDLVAMKLAKIMPFCFVGVGAGFEFFAGNQRRSPKFMNQLGLEWVFRLSREPKRLANRYLKGNFLFLLIVLKREVLKIAYCGEKLQ